MNERVGRDLMKKEGATLNAMILKIYNSYEGTLLTLSKYTKNGRERNKTWWPTM